MNVLNDLVLLSKVQDKLPNLDWKLVEVISKDGNVDVTVDGVDYAVNILSCSELQMMPDKTNLCAKIESKMLSKEHIMWVWISVNEYGCYVRVKEKTGLGLGFQYLQYRQINSWRGGIDYCLKVLEVWLNYRALL